MAAGLKAAAIRRPPSAPIAWLDDNEWVDPAILDQLTGNARRVTIDGVGKTLADFSPSR